MFSLNIRITKGNVMRKKVETQENFDMLPEENVGFIIDTENVEESDTAATEKDNKFFALLKSKKFIITSSIIVSVIALLAATWFVLSSLWRSGKLALPAFLADMGLFQGESFEYLDGITVNGIDISGLDIDKAKAKIEKEISNKKSYNITVAAGESSFVLGSEDVSYVLKDNGVLEQAKEYCVKVLKGEAKKEKRDFTVEIVLSEESKNKIVAKAKETFEKAPIDATFSGVSEGAPQFTDDENGYSVDETVLLDTVSKYLAAGNSDGTVNVVLTVVKANVTKEDLSEKIVLLASHSTTSSNTAAGNHNMKKAMDMCNGSIIKPGEIWSFNGCTGNSNIESDGWKKAVVYVGGRQDYGVGGGICQASTTIYNAALMANLGIVERHYHIWAAGYAKAGFDATIDYPGLDLQLQNNTEYPVYIECYMDGKKLVANIYGYHTDEYDEITLSSYVSERVEGEYYKVVTSRILWKNGEKVATHSLPLSKYSLKPKLWAGEDEEEEESSSSSSSSSSNSETSNSNSTSTSDSSNSSSDADSSTSESTSEDGAESESGSSNEVHDDTNS